MNGSFPRFKRFLTYTSVITLILTGANVNVTKAQDPAENHTARALRAHIKFLADDLLEGHFPGTDGYDIAASYVAAQFEQLDLIPAGNMGYLSKKQSQSFLMHMHYQVQTHGFFRPVIGISVK